jgi:hypothetical protein
MTSLALDSAAIATTGERAVAGDELAFARIVAAYHLDLVRVAFAMADRGSWCCATICATLCTWLRISTSIPACSSVHSN